MKVYILIESFWYEADYVRGVFSSAEQARSIADSQNAEIKAEEGEGAQHSWGVQECELNQFEE